MGNDEEISLYEKLVSYAECDCAAFHMPGHKRQVREAALLPDGLPWKIDITEIDGFDNLHHAEGILKDSMEAAARFYGVKRCMYSVNGSTAGILSAIFAVTKPGDSILMGRNCHKSVWNAVLLRELGPCYIYPQIDADSGIACGYLPEEIETVLITHPEIHTVIVTSPTYEGVVSDICSIAKIVHRHNAVLIVDEAHGAHLDVRMQEEGQTSEAESPFPHSAVREGADLVIQSLHKTLPALTQTAVVLVGSDRIDSGEVARYLSIFQTSSPSYVLMASIDGCLRYMASEQGRQDWRQFGQNVLALRKHFKGYRKISLVELPGAEPSKLVIRADGMGGRELYDVLREEYGIQPEMCTETTVLLMTGMGDTLEMYERLCESLSQLDNRLVTEETVASADRKSANGVTNEKMERKGNPPENDKAWAKTPSRVCTPSEADQKAAEEIPLEESEGRVSSEYAYLYPPGIPILVPGERIGRVELAYLLENAHTGRRIQGLRDGQAKKIRVLCEN